MKEEKIEVVTCPPPTATEERDSKEINPRRCHILKRKSSPPSDPKTESRSMIGVYVRNIERVCERFVTNGTIE